MTENKDNIDNVKCVRCKCNKLYMEFFRNNKNFKTCNQCYNSRKVKNKINASFSERKCGDDINNHRSNHLRIKYIAHICKGYDIKNNLLDIDNLIDETSIKKLIDDQQNKCIHCQCELKFNCNANDSCLAIMERKDCNIGHIKNNCQLICFGCALKK